MMWGLGDSGEIVEMAEQIVGLGINQKIAGYGSSSKKHRAFHVATIGQCELDRKCQSSRESRGGANDHPVLGAACGIADDFKARQGSRAGNHGTCVVLGFERYQAGSFVDFDVCGVQGRSARSCIGLGHPWQRAQIGQADPLMASYEQPRAGALGARQVILARQFTSGVFGKHAFRFPDSLPSLLHVR